MKKRWIILLAGGIGLVLLIALGVTAGVVLAKRSPHTSISLAFSPRLAIATSEQEKGILVAGVLPDSPAAKAGLKRGDILLKVDNKEVNNLKDLQDIIDEKQPGDKLELTILHGDDQRSLTVTLGEQKEQPFLGILSCGPGNLGRDFIYRIHPGRGALPSSTEGATVVEVLTDSPADKAGLKEGDRILSVDGEKVTVEMGLAELIGKHKPGETIDLEVIRKGKEETQKITITLGENPDEEGKAFLGIHYAPVAEVSIQGENPPNEIPFPPFMRPDVRGGRFQLPEGVTSGVWVGKVTEGSPADKAGLQKGDLITAIDAESIQDLNPRDFTKTIQKYKPDDKITLTVYRDDKDEAMQVQVTLGEDPDQAGKAYLGIEVMGFINIDRSNNPKGNFFYKFQLPDWFNFGNRPERRAPTETPESSTEM
jgi:S1-C subfamily serine protease